MKQIPLPSGRTAQMRPMTWGDWIGTATIPAFETRVMAVACRLTTIDGKALTPEEACSMSMLEAGPLMRAVIAEINSALVAAPEPEAQPIGVTLQ